MLHTMNRFRGPLFLLLFVSIAGCGTGEYGKRFQARLSELQRQAPFTRHLYGGDTPLTDQSDVQLGLFIRLPKFFDREPLRTNSQNELGGRIDENRTQPPFLRFPGYSMTYEKFMQDKQSRGLPLHCYIAAVPVKGSAEVDLQTQLADQVKAAFPEAQLTWEEVALPTPTGETITWKRLSVEGEQRFDAQDDLSHNLPGRFQIDLHSFEHVRLMLGWRAPDSIAEEAQFFPAANAALGTARSEGPPATEGTPAETPAETTPTPSS